MTISNAFTLEWEAAPGEQLTGHEEHLAACHYRGSVIPPGAGPIQFWCASYGGNASTYGLTLDSVLVDSSTYDRGCLIHRRLTWYRTLKVMSCPVLIFPFRISKGNDPARPAGPAEGFPQ